MSRSILWLSLAACIILTAFILPVAAGDSGKPDEERAEFDAFFGNMPLEYKTDGVKQIKYMIDTFIHEELYT